MVPVVVFVLRHCARGDTPAAKAAHALELLLGDGGGHPHSEGYIGDHPDDGNHSHNTFVNHHLPKDLDEYVGRHPEIMDVLNSLVADPAHVSQSLCFEIIAEGLSHFPSLSHTHTHTHTRTHSHARAPAPQLTLCGDQNAHHTPVRIMLSFATQSNRASEMISALHRAQFHDRNSISDEGLTKLFECLRYAMQHDDEGAGNEDDALQLSVGDTCRCVSRGKKKKRSLPMLHLAADPRAM